MQIMIRLHLKPADLDLCFQTRIYLDVGGQGLILFAVL